MPRAQHAIDENKLNAFIGQMLSDLGGASSVALVRMGDSLGLYKTLQAEGPMTAAELARAAKVDERCLRLRRALSCRPCKPWCSPTKRVLST